MRILKAIYQLLAQAATQFTRDKVSMLAAGLSYYALFSLAPILVIVVTLAGRVLGQAAVRGEIVTRIGETVGTEAAILIENLVLAISSDSSSLLATLISLGILLFAASNLFNHMRRALDQIYGVLPDPAQGLRSMLLVVRSRFVAGLIVLLLGLLLLFALTLNSVLLLAVGFLNDLIPGATPLPASLTSLVPISLIFVLILIVFKTLPNVEISWRDVAVGAAVTTGLFWIGQSVIGIYLRFSNTSSVYGAAGSIIVLLLWVYYSMQIMLFGAELTKVYANRYGRPIVPRDEAIFISELYNNLLSAAAEAPPAEAPPLPLLIEPEPPPPPSRQARLSVAFAFIGLAAGLLIAYVNNSRRR